MNLPGWLGPKTWADKPRPAASRPFSPRNSPLVWNLFPRDLVFRRAACNANAVVNYGFATGNTACRFACVHPFRLTPVIDSRPCLFQVLCLVFFVVMHSRFCCIRNFENYNCREFFFFFNSTFHNFYSTDLNISMCNYRGNDKIFGH